MGENWQFVEKLRIVPLRDRCVQGVQKSIDGFLSIHDSVYIKLADSVLTGTASGVFPIDMWSDILIFTKSRISKIAVPQLRVLNKFINFGSDNVALFSTTIALWERECAQGSIGPMFHLLIDKWWKWGQWFTIANRVLLVNFEIEISNHSMWGPSIYCLCHWCTTGGIVVVVYVGDSDYSRRQWLCSVRRKGIICSIIRSWSSISWSQE